MILYQDHIGLSLTQSKLQLVEVCSADEKFSICNIDEEYLNEFISDDLKETKFISNLQSAFDDLVLRKSPATNNVSFTLPHDFFKIFDIPIDETLMKDDILENYKWHLSVLYPEVNPENYIFDKIKFEVDGNTELITAINRQLLKTIHKFCSRNNLILRFVDNQHFASMPLINSISNTEGDEKIASLYLADDYFSLLILQKGKPLYFELKKIGNVSHLSESTNQIINKLGSKGIDISNISKTFICGENISEVLINQLSEELKIVPVKFNPFKGIDVNEHLTQNKFYTDKNNTFTSALSIALRIF